MEPIDPSRMKGRKWVMREIEKMDPETQYEEIISLFMQYTSDMFALHYTVVTGTMHNILPRSGAETLAYTNKIVRRPMKRNEDGLAFFWIWFGKGPSHPDTIASVKRLNQIHMQVAKQLPGNFSHNDEFVYTLAMIGIFNDRLLKKLGLGGMPEKLKIAMHHELRDLSKLFMTEGGLVHDFPEDFQGLHRFCEDFENRRGSYTSAATDVCNAMIADFATRWFPKPLQWFGRAMMIYGAQDVVIRQHRLKPLSPFTRFVTHWAMKAMFYAKLHIMPDSKVSFLDTWKPLTLDEIREADRAAATRADEAGWIRGGEHTLAVTRGKASDAHGHGDGQPAPVSQSPSS